MPRKKRQGEYATLYAEIPTDLHKYLEERAGRNNRTITGEVAQILTELRTRDEAAKIRAKGKPRA